MRWASPATSRTVAFLEEGRILEEGPPERMFSEPREEATRRFLDGSSRPAGCSRSCRDPRRAVLDWRADAALQDLLEFRPSGDQPEAIDRLVDGVQAGQEHVTLLGATGTGKTFTVAHLVEQVQRPTLVIAPNKSLAAQLANEFARSSRRTRSSTS